MKKLALFACAAMMTVFCLSCDEKTKQYNGTYQGDMISGTKTLKSGMKMYVGGVTENQLYVYGVPLVKQSEGEYVGRGETLEALIKTFYANDAIEKLENVNMAASFGKDIMNLRITYEIQLVGFPLEMTLITFNGKKISKSNQESN